MHGIISTARARSTRVPSGSWPKKTDPQPVAFGDLARFAYPIKTIESLGAATVSRERPSGAPRSTIKAWLNGTNGVPSWVLAICTAEIMRRYAVGQ